MSIESVNSRRALRHTANRLLTSLDMDDDALDLVRLAEEVKSWADRVAQLEQKSSTHGKA